MWSMNRRALLAMSAAVGAVTASTTLVPTGAAQRSATPVAGESLATRIRPLIAPLMKELFVPGVIVLVRNGEDEYLEAFGTRDIGQQEAMTTDDHFRVGSNTKTMTGTIILQLVQEGKLALTDPVATYRPDVPNGENITIAQLMDMTSGLASYSFDPQFNRYMDDDPQRTWDPEELIAIGLAKPPEFAPGTGFFYSNTNTTLLGRIAEDLTGGQLSDLMQERLFAPLNLAHTRFPAINDSSLPDPHPHGYLYGNNVSTIHSNALPLYQQEQVAAGTLLPTDVTDVNPSWAWAAGAAISTASDLATYVEALVGGGLLDEATQAERLASLKVPPGSTEPDAAKYGLALAEFGTMIGHDGSVPGFTSFMGHNPAASTTLIVMATLQSSPDGLMAANEFAKKILPVLAAS